MEQRCSDLAGPPVCGECGLERSVPRLRGEARLFAASEAMRALLRRTSRFAANDAPVAIRGETGTGKEVIARVLHANSPRKAHAFVAVNVAALPTELLESELFGHGKGAFTGADAASRGLFEVADKGTLFLDEIGEMPLALQAKLLRVLQDGEVRRVGQAHAFAVDVRIVCATHRDLALLVREGTFRQDLYYRLKVLTLDVPPLRARTEDILPLATQFLSELRGPAKRFAVTAQRCLTAYDWPGNVRELENAVKHGAALASSSVIDEADLPDEVRGIATDASAPFGGRDRVWPPKTLAEVERDHILSVLQACQGSQVEAARALGVARNTLWRKLRAMAPPES